MLIALARPLLLARQAWRRTKAAMSEKIHHSIRFLLHDLAGAARALGRRLNAFGVRRACRSLWKKVAARLQSGPDGRKAWPHLLIVACRKCAARLCPLFQAAQAMADRASSRLAYGVLRTLEKELWSLQLNTRPVVAAGPA